MATGAPVRGKSLLTGVPNPPLPAGGAGVVAGVLGSSDGSCDSDGSVVGSSDAGGDDGSSDGTSVGTPDDGTSDGVSLGSSDGTPLDGVVEGRHGFHGRPWPLPGPPWCWPMPPPIWMPLRAPTLPDDDCTGDGSTAGAELVTVADGLAHGRGLWWPSPVADAGPAAIDQAAIGPRTAVVMMAARVCGFTRVFFR